MLRMILLTEVQLRNNYDGLTSKKKKKCEMLFVTNRYFIKERMTRAV